jgi:hypothetical protein
LGSLISGALRDVLNLFFRNPIMPYVIVFAGMAILMLISLWMLTHIDVRLFRKQAEQRMKVVESLTLVD